MSKGQSYRAVLELLIAAALWGFGFIATKWALGTLNIPELVFLRFALATLIGLPWLLSSRHNVKFKLRLSFWPGALLMGTLLFQTWGLEYTTPTKSGFITTLYVVMVPLLESVISRRPLSMGMWSCVILALVGTSLIVDMGFSSLNIGDVLTFVSAIFAAGQIYLMGSVSPRISRAFIFNLYQSFWCLLMIIPLVRFDLLLPKVANVSEWPKEAVIGLITLSAGSTTVAFYLQVRAQKYLSRTVSSLMFLLESPFAMIFSILLLSEHLNLRESIGAAIIFVSAFLAIWLEKRKLTLPT